MLVGFLLPRFPAVEGGATSWLSHFREEAC
jgi:hypothetical protein